MRQALLRGRLHGSKSTRTILEDVPIMKVMEEFKSIQASPSNEKYEYVEMWTSNGGFKCVKNILTPKALKERKDRETKAKAEAEAKIKPALK